MPETGTDEFSERLKRILADLREATAAQRERSLRFVADVERAWLEATGNQVQLIRNRRDELLTALEEMTLSEEEAAAARRQINERADIEIAASRKRIVKEADETSVAMKQITDRIEDGLVHALQQGEGAFDSLRNVALTALRDIHAQLLRTLVVKPLVSGIGSLFGGLFGSLFGGSVATSPATLIGMGLLAKGGIVGSSSIPKRPLPAALLAGAPRFAGGGMLGAGEVPAILHKGEMVLNQGQQRRAFSGPSVVIHQTIQVSTGVAQTVRAEVLALAPQLAEMSKAAVQDARLRDDRFFG